MANTLVWESVGAGCSLGWRPRAAVAARAGSRRPGAPARATALRTSVPASRSRSRRQPVAWRRILVLGGDVLMVAVWAAMVPGLMWLGAAAGF